MISTIQNIINRNRVSYCLECGKCSAVCPITRWDRGGYASPRLLVEKAIEGRIEEVLNDRLFWSCLTCMRCSELCSSDVYFSEFLREVRAFAGNDDRSGNCTHGDVVQTWGRIMTDPAINQNRIGWLESDLRVSNDSDTVYFVGCLPYYDTMFKKLDVEGVQIARATVKILNHLGIDPQVLANERCCGHDQLWEGDIKTFRSLAKLNLAQLRATGAKRIVTSCPECSRTLNLDYPKLVGPHGMEVLHLTQLLGQSAESGKLDFVADGSNLAVTYQDPCRLGHHQGVYNEPRALLSALGLKLIEMDRARKTSICCGTSCWASCGQVSKNIQVERLKEAKATGSDLLVTACVKCQIHFKCAQDDPTLKEKIDIKVRDITTLLAERLFP